MCIFSVGNISVNFWLIKKKLYNYNLEIKLFNLCTLTAVHIVKTWSSLVFKGLNCFQVREIFNDKPAYINFNQIP